MTPDPRLAIYRRALGIAVRDLFRLDSPATRAAKETAFREYREAEERLRRADLRTAVLRTEGRR